MRNQNRIYITFSLPPFEDASSIPSVNSWLYVDNVSIKRVSFLEGGQMFQFGGVWVSFVDTVKGKRGVEGRLGQLGECRLQPGG